MKLDPTLDEVQNARFMTIYHKLIMQTVKAKPHLTEQDVQLCLLIYHKFVLANGKRAKHMTRMQFGELLHVFYNVRETNLVDTMLSIVDPDLKNFVSAEGFIKLLDIWSGSLEKKLKFCFKVYDTQGTGKIGRDALKKYYRAVIYAEMQEDVEEIANDMVDLVIRKMDIDRDGKISFEDYAESVRRNPCLLEFIGQCIPDIKSLIRIFYGPDYPLPTWE